MNAFLKYFTPLPSFFFSPQVNNIRKQGVPFLTFVHVHVNICKHINMLIMGLGSAQPSFYEKESYDIYSLHLACVMNQKTPVESPPKELAFVYCILSDGCIMIQGRGHHPGLPSPNSLPLENIRHTTSGSPLPRLGWRWGSLGNPISFLFSSSLCFWHPKAKKRLPLFFLLLWSFSWQNKPNMAWLAERSQKQKQWEWEWAEKNTC